MFYMLKFFINQWFNTYIKCADVDNTEHSAHRIIEGVKGYATSFVDFSVLTPSSGDIIQCMNVDEGTLVTGVYLLIVTADTGTKTVDIGDDTDENGYDDNVDVTATAGTVTKMLEATDPYGAGKYYTTDDTIDLLVNNASTATGQVLLFVEYVRTAHPTVLSTL